jgi:hypothetical protein
VDQRRSVPVSGRALTIVATACLSLAASGCTGFKQSMGGGKVAPDETAVATRAPLVVPATFDLKAPQPGAPRPQDSDTAAAAQRVLGGGTAKSAPASEGEKALLGATGANAADPNIRQELRQEVREQRKRKSYSDTVLFWRGDRVEVGSPLDPREEAQRVRTMQPTPQPAPVIEKMDTAAPAPTTVETEAAAEEAEKKEEKEDEEGGGWFDWF